MQSSVLEKQLQTIRSNGLFAKLEKAARAHGIETAYLLAIGSRESGLRNILGDYRGGLAHGVGILQIDVQHPIALHARDTGSWWPNPDPLIAFGAALLASNLKSVRALRPAFDDRQAHKCAASAYNCGLGNALAGSAKGDSDKFTTGGSYGRDVMDRMAIFQDLLAG
jgi:Transglycosylase SLT domain